MIFCSPTPLAMPWKRLSMRCSRLHLHNAFSTQAEPKRLQSFQGRFVHHSRGPHKDFIWFRVQGSSHSTPVVKAALFCNTPAHDAALRS